MMASAGVGALMIMLAILSNNAVIKRWIEEAAVVALLVAIWGLL